MNLFPADTPRGIFTIKNVPTEEDKAITKPDYDALPVFPTRNLVLFPGVALPVTVARKQSLDLAQWAESSEGYIGVFCQIDPAEDSPGVKDLFNYGVVARVIKVLELPDGSHTALVQADGKVKIEADVTPTGDPCMKVKVKPISEIGAKAEDTEIQVLVKSIRDIAESIFSQNQPDVMVNVESVTNPSILINTFSTMLPIELEKRMDMLAMRSVKKRGETLLAQVTRSSEMITLSRELQQRAKESLDERQRSVFLEQQMAEITKELYGDEGDEHERMKRQGEETEFTPEARKQFDKELEKLRRLNPQSPEYSVQRNYLDILLDLPWGKSTPLEKDIKKAEEVLEHDHFGLDKVKERILEQIAVMINNPNGKAPIICLVGPPGVGKTSLGRSIARALGRAYERVSLGGVNDEAEIRGHRRTYIGAMPGRIIAALRKAESSNPVLLLDEIDKVGRDYKSDPSSALLEVLDPEQNSRFHDNYIDVDYDLSRVLFIATANTLTTIPQPLLDRMEIIDIAGYLPEEKIEIARRHLLPRIYEELGMVETGPRLDDATIEAVIDKYTAESGVRQLEKTLTNVLRKALLKEMRQGDKITLIHPDDLQGFLRAPLYNRERYEGNEFAGVVTGLAWTAVGGEILFIESSVSAGKGEKLTLTGNLGDVMKESAVIALQYVKSHAQELGIDPELFDKYNLHIHVPEGAIPKDGPSAGITMATSIVSTFTQKRVRERLAMTGEITLRGKVLPVGGIKEKILAAKRAGITDIALSEENRKDVEDINEIYRRGLTFHYVNTVMDVLSLAITDRPASDARPL